VWLLVIAAVLPILVLSQRQKTALLVLLVTAYAFTIAIVVQASTSLRALAPSSSVGSWIAYVANIITVGAGLFAGLLTFWVVSGHLRVINSAVWCCLTSA